MTSTLTSSTPTPTTLPAPRRTRTAAVLLASAGLLALPACGTVAVAAPTPAAVQVQAGPPPGSGSGGGSGGAVPMRTTTAATPTPSAPAGDAATEAAADGLRPFLITTADLGPGYAPADEPQPDPSGKAVCGGPGVVAQFPRAVRVGTAFTGTDVYVQEAVSVYGDAATASAAYQAVLEGFSCSQGSVNGEPAVLTPAQDLRADVGGQYATGWQVGTDAYDVVVVSVLNDSVVLQFTYVSPVDRQTGLPDPLAISRAGVQKLGG